MHTFTGTSIKNVILCKRIEAFSGIASFSVNLCAEVGRHLAGFSWDVDVNLNKRVEAANGLESGSENLCASATSVVEEEVEQ